MKYFKKIEGNRIYLSPINVDDVVTYTKWMNDSSVTDGLGTGSSLTTLSSETDWLNKANGYQFAIIKKDNDELLGNCGFHNINNIHQIATVGIFIGEEINRNKGYGEETLRLLINYGFNYLNLHNIMLNVYSFNENAIRCYEKVGFKEYGRRKECYYLNNHRYDEINMQILKTDFIEKEGGTHV